jgi:predicted Zn-dependent peptidase
VLQARRHIFKIVVTVSLFILSGCEQADFNLDAFTIDRVELKNGLVAILVEDHKVPIVSFNTWVRVGSAWEHEGKTGLSHLFEHLMFKETYQRPKLDYIKELERKGASVNAFTQSDVTTYFEVFSKQHLDDVLALESERLVGIKLDQAVLDAEKKVVLEERRMRIDGNFSSQLFQELNLLAFGNHPYSAPVIGYQEDIEGITLEDCLEFKRKYYQPGNVVLAIVGDIDIPSVREKIKKLYGSIPGERTKLPSSLEPLVFDGEIRKTIYRPVLSESLLMAYAAPDKNSEDFPALNMLNWILFEMNSARILQHLVRDKQVATSVSGSIHQGIHPGLYMISATLRIGVPAELVIRELDAQMEAIRAKPLDLAELNRAKKKLAYSTYSTSKTASGLASLLMLGEYYYGNMNKSLELFEKYKNVSVTDLQRVADKYLNPSNRIVVTMKPQEVAGLGGSK